MDLNLCCLKWFELVCGIASIFVYDSFAPPVDEAELLRMRERMVPRGPDGSGLWTSQNRRIGLAHRRLSIIDLSEDGAQPMPDPQNGNVIVFNGEIYNYRELRIGLEKRGYRFRSASDTEVLLHLYAQKGMELVHDLRGMYAIVLWDEREQSLFLVRDPFGIKPLYIADDGKTIRAASQVKALLAGGRIDTTPEPAGHAGFFLWGHVPEPFTLYKGVYSLKPGTILRVRANQSRGTGHESRIFCSIPEEIAHATSKVAKVSPADAQTTLRDALLGTVRAHLVADVQVGVFLSSGLDSTTIAALAAEVGAALCTVTLGFEEYRGTHDDEVPLAELVAKQYGARHQTVWVTREEFCAEYDKLLDAMDQPTIDGVNSYFVSMAARKAGLKVVLSGLGGDELFGGYPSFQQIPKSVKTFGWANCFPLLGKGFRTIATPFVPHTASPKYASVLEYGGSYAGAYLLRRALMMPWELPQVLDAEMAKEGLDSLQTLVRLGDTEKAIVSAYGKVSAMEITWYMRNQLLRDTDWASMAHSLEIRVPLVDLQLLRAATPLIGQFGRAGKQAIARTPRQTLPEAILNRPKSGFGVPTREWLLPPGASKGAGSRVWALGVYRKSLEAVRARV